MQFRARFFPIGNWKIESQKKYHFWLQEPSYPTKITRFYRISMSQTSMTSFYMKSFYTQIHPLKKTANPINYPTVNPNRKNSMDHFWPKNRADSTLSP